MHSDDKPKPEPSKIAQIRGKYTILQFLKSKITKYADVLSFNYIMIPNHANHRSYIRRSQHDGFSGQNPNSPMENPTNHR